MSYRVTGLSPEPFRHLFSLPDAELAAHNAKRYVVDANPGFPDRIELRDLNPGETCLLVNHEHQPARSPYRASHAVFIREGAETTASVVNEIPKLLRLRTISLRAFDSAGMMLDGDLVEGDDIERVIIAMLDDPEVDNLHAHYAKRGCYAARIDRA